MNILIILAIAIGVSVVLLADNYHLREDNQILTDDLSLQIQHYEWLQEMTEFMKQNPDFQMPVTKPDSKI